MSKYLLSILLVMFTVNFAIGQELNRGTFAGEWTVIQVVTSSNNLKKEEKQIIETMKKGYLNSKFNFKTNGKFTIEFRKGAPEFMNQFKFLNNKDWKFSERERLISIGTKEDSYNHMRMYVKKHEGKIYFAFNDTPLVLEMKKS